MELSQSPSTDKRQETPQRICAMEKCFEMADFLKGRVQLPKERAWLRAALASQLDCRMYLLDRFCCMASTARTM